jgi:hypothetical protein
VWSVALAATILAAGCTRAAGGGDPPSRPVTGGQVRLAISPAFRAMLAQRGLHLVWNAPPCSWRLMAPACGGAPVTDPDAVVVPIVGGAVSVWTQGAKLRGRIELAGHLDVTGPRAVLALDDLTIAPADSTLAAGTPSAAFDAFFLDGTAATFAATGASVEVKGVAVKLLRAVGDQIAATLGVTGVPDFIKVGDLDMTVAKGSGTAPG